MSPGFDYADFQIGDREQLIAQYPDAAEMIRDEVAIRTSLFTVTEKQPRICTDRLGLSLA